MNNLPQTPLTLDATPETLEDQARLLAAMARSTAEAHEQVFELKHELASGRETFRAEIETEILTLRTQLADQIRVQTALKTSLDELTALLAESERDKAALNKDLISRDAQMTSLWEQIEVRDRKLPRLEKELKALKEQLITVEAEKHEALGRAAQLDAFHRELLSSTSWRITSPLRGLSGVLHKD